MEHPDNAEQPGSTSAEPIPEEETGKWVGGSVDGEATYAPVECLLPGGHWRGFDPTNGILANDAYAKVHYG